jgi:hypothetical protein
LLDCFAVVHFQIAREALSCSVADHSDQRSMIDDNFDMDDILMELDDRYLLYRDYFYAAFNQRDS